MCQEQLRSENAHLRASATHLRAKLLERRAPGVEAVFAEVAEVSAEALGVARASVWMLDAERQVLVCKHLHVRGGAAQPASEIPVCLVQCYVRALNEDLLAADDVATDPRLVELWDYCARREIGALLDVPIVVEGEVLGVICHEHVGGPRPWRDVEINFAANLGCAVSLAIEAERRHEAQERAREAAARYRHLVETLPVVIYSIDAPTGRLAYVSPAIEALLGCTAEGWLAGGVEGWLASIIEEDRPLVRARLQGPPGGAAEPELIYRMRRGDGGVIWLRDLRTVVRGAAGEPLAVQGTLEDITERLRLEAELAQQRKFESLGRMAAGVAHDFNNVLTVISLALAHGGKSGEIDAAMAYARELVSSLMAYARREPLAVQDVDVDAAIEALAPVLATAVGKDLHLDFELRAAGSRVRIAPTELRQLVVNMVANAGEATRGHGHRVRVSTAMLAGDAADRPCVELRIADDGRGMDEATRARVFDPFFTTKPPGEGTGIGLATCQSIVARAGGTIGVDSQLGVGTAFRVALPLAARPADRGATAAGQGAGLRVLFVEDSPAVGDFVHHALGAAGHEVVLAPSVGKALAALEGGRFDVVIADLRLPDGRGEEIVEAVRARSTRIAIVVASGEAAVINGVDAVVMKPFSTEELKAGIARALEHRREIG